MNNETAKLWLLIVDMMLLVTNIIIGLMILRRDGK